jgi:DNA-binding NarL/FixJ family response regulator
MRVLIADSSALVRERLTYLLGDLKGVEIAGQARDAMEARSLAKRLKPDVAILDVRLPKGTATALLFDVKKANPSAKVIVLTNDTFPEVRDKCIEEGRTTSLTSPRSFRRWFRC